MNEMKKILNGSIKEFQDKVENATATPASYLVGKNGLAYVMPDTVSESITCAIHVTTDQVQNVEGIFNMAFVEVNTQKDIFSLFSVSSSPSRGTVTVKFTGASGTVIPKGSRCTGTGTPTVQTIITATIPVAGFISVLCETIAYNTSPIPALSITALTPTISGVTCTNLLAGTHGTIDAPAMVLITYRGLTIGVNKSGSYNNVAQTYHYTGEIIQNRNKGFIITDNALAESLFLSNSTAKWLEFGTYCGVTIYPSFLTPSNKESAYMTIEIVSTVSRNIVSQVSDIIKKQYLIDTCRLRLINGTLIQAQNIADKLNEQAKESRLFGMMDFPSWTQTNDDTQKSFGIKTNLRVMDMKINYQLESGASNALKYIKTATADIAINSIGGV